MKDDFFKIKLIQKTVHSWDIVYACNKCKIYLNLNWIFVEGDTDLLDNLQRLGEVLNNNNNDNSRRRRR